MRRLAPWVLPLIGITSCTGATGPAGTDGESVRGDDGLPGAAGDPPPGTLRSISPSQLFLGRTVDVALEGFGTAWTEDAVIAFDPASPSDDQDITVVEVRRGSPTALVATVIVSQEAVQGLRDVTVTMGEEVARLEGALRIAQPLELLVFPQVESIHQGGLAAPVTQMNDPRTPFTPGSLSWIPGGARTLVYILEPYYAGAFVSVDVFAATGPTTLHVSTPAGAGLQVIESVAPGVIDVRARTPELISDNRISMVFDDFGTRLFEVETNNREALQIAIDVDTTAADFAFYVLPPSGRWEQLLSETVHQSTAPLPPEAYAYAPSAGSFYFLVRPFGNNLGYELEIDVQRRDVFPMAITAPATIERPTLTAPNLDVFEITADAGDIITAIIGDGPTDTCAPTGAIKAEMWVVDAAGNTMPGYRAYPTNLCPRIEVPVPEQGTYSIVVGAHTKQPFEFLDGDTPCAPTNSCNFDYTLTVAVD